MTRRDLLRSLLALPIGLGLAAPALAAERVRVRRPDGGVWGLSYLHPSELTEADVDRLMWPLVRRINRSGWVWTTDSCQGLHASYPMTLGLVTDDLLRLASIIEQARQEAPLVVRPYSAAGQGAETLLRNPHDATQGPLGRFPLALIGEVTDVNGQRAVLEAYSRVAGAVTA